MPFLTYDGTAQDHEDTPQALRVGEDGRPIRNKVAKPAKRRFFAIETMTVYGKKFPAGVAVEVANVLPADKAIVAKAKALKCFKITDVAPVEAEEVYPAEPILAQSEPEAEPEEVAPKKRGRPKKTAEE